MATEQETAGPQVCQIVQYNNAGTIVPGIIYALGQNGTADILCFSGSGVTAVSNAVYNENLAPGSWSYPLFL